MNIEQDEVDLLVEDARRAFGKRAVAGLIILPLVVCGALSASRRLLNLPSKQVLLNLIGASIVIGLLIFIQEYVLEPIVYEFRLRSKKMDQRLTALARILTTLNNEVVRKTDEVHEP